MMDKTWLTRLITFLLEIDTKCIVDTFRVIRVYVS